MIKHFVWKKAYEIGIGEIDREHQRLFEIGNEIEDIDDPVKEMDRLKRALYDLFEYMKEHFAHEEAVMEKINYPHLEEHRKMHQHLTEELNNILKNTKGFNLLEDKLVKLIKEWIVEHIEEHDLKIGEYLIKQKKAK